MFERYVMVPFGQYACWRKELKEEALEQLNMTENLTEKIIRHKEK